MADFWSQFPTSGPQAPTFDPMRNGPETPTGPNDPRLQPVLPYGIGGTDFGIFDPNKFAGMPKPPTPDPNWWKQPGADVQNPPPFYRPSVDPGGYVPTDSQRQGENDWYAKNIPGWSDAMKNPVPPERMFMPQVVGGGTIGGGRTTLGNFLNNPQAMQAVGGMARNIGGLFGNRPAQPQGGMMPMRSLFGSAMGSALGQGAQQAARVMMRAPDGTTQSVDPAHVDHYTGLGAQVINGSSYGGGGY